MPPKKQEEEQSAPAIIWTILPIVVNSSVAVEALKKPVNIKKAVDTNKIIQLLKEKGIEKYIVEGTLTRQGDLFLCQHMHTVGQQFLAQSRKPADPKKEQKKDTKKDSKKEEVPVEEAQKPIQFDFPKGVTQFLFYNQTPIDQEALQTAVKGGLRPEIVIWIEEKIKQGSQAPNYNLLNNQRTIQDFLSQMNGTSPEKYQNSVNNTELQTSKRKKKEGLQTLINLRAKRNSDLQNTIIIQVPFQKDLQHPEKDITQFLTNLFKKICELSLQKQKFESWIKTQKVSTMVPTIKEKVKRQVVVEQKKQDKKGGKKDAVTQPVVQIIEQIVEKKYQSFPENIKSDLKLYKRVSKQTKRQEDQSIYHKVLKDLAYSISLKTEPRKPEKIVKDLGQSLWNLQQSKPVTKVSVQNLKNKLRTVTYAAQNQQLNYKITLQPVSLTTSITLADILQHYPNNRSLQHEYKLKQFVQLNKMQGKRVFLNFDDRKYVQRIESQVVNSIINQQLQYDPRAFYGKCEKDNYHLLILLRVNPPGRILYKNQIFDWKVLPNFQFWQQNFKTKDPNSEYWDYNWRDTGNLKILNKRMMPTDNSVIVESSYFSGDTQKKLVTIAKDNILYGLKRNESSGYVFWKSFQNKKTTIHLAKHQAQSKLQICINKEEYTVIFNPNPTIIWNHHEIEESRSFGPNGQITKRLHNGIVQIYYPNGDISTLKFGSWTHIKNNTIYQQGKQSRELKRQKKIDTDKFVEIRQDSTTFVTFLNRDTSIVFTDGTIIRKLGTKKIKILNPSNIIVRVILKRQKDLNVIGSGSAFAYLGQTNLLERSYDGSLYEFYDNSFSWHSYTQAVDINGQITFQNIMLVAYPDQSIIKAGSKGQITFLNRATETNQSSRHQRWIQLFTAAQYHHEGVYDVDLIEGEVKTKDAESNMFRVRVDGTGIAEIAVSFNIGNSKEQKNDFGSGFHVPQQNFFLPVPENKNPAKLFVIYPDGSADQYLSHSQIDELRSWKTVSISSNNRNYTQYFRQIKSASSYLHHSFTQEPNLQVFALPNILEQVAIVPNLIKYNYNRVQSRNIQSIEWNPSFEKINEAENSIRQKREKIEKQLASLRSRIQI